MLRFFLFSCLFLGTSAFQCNGTTTLLAPSNLTLSTYYPGEWREDQPLPQVDADQGCVIDVTIPSGVYATVNFFRKFGQTASAYVLYPNNKYSVLKDNDNLPYIFTSPKFRLVLSTAKQVASNDTGFAFKITWAQYVIPRTNIVNIYKGRAPVAVQANDALTAFVGASGSSMSLVAFNLKGVADNSLLRQSAIFAGDSVLGEFVGTLEQVVNSKTKLTAYKNKLAVYTFGLNKLVDYPLFMGQNYEDSQGVWTYEAVNCPSKGTCNVQLDSNGIKSWTVTDYDGEEIIKDFPVFPDGVTVQVYENNVSNTTCVATFKSSNYKQHVPFTVKGNMKFYVVNGGGNVQMVLTRDTSRASRL